jgi:hypothetical protein
VSGEQINLAIKTALIKTTDKKNTLGITGRFYDGLQSCGIPVEQEFEVIRGEGERLFRWIHA